MLTATSKAQRQPWLTIVLGIVSLVVTVIYYKSIVHSTQITYGEIDIFETYGWTIVLFGFVLTVWSFIKIKRLNKLWLLGLIFLANVFVFYYAFDQVKPLSYQIRFSLTNKTNLELTQMKILSDRQFSLNNLSPNATINFIYSAYSENSSIELVYNYKNKMDTIYLTSVVTNGIGEQLKIALTDNKGNLIVDND